MGAKVNFAVSAGWTDSLAYTLLMAVQFSITTHRVRSWDFQLNQLTKTSSKEKQMDTSSLESSNMTRRTAGSMTIWWPFFCWYAVVCIKMFEWNLKRIGELPPGARDPDILELRTSTFLGIRTQVEAAFAFTTKLWLRWRASFLEWQDGWMVKMVKKKGLQKSSYPKTLRK